MKIFLVLKTWLLMLCLVLMTSGIASAKSASGGIYLAADVYQGLGVSKSLNALGVDEVSTMSALESPLATKGGKKGLGGNPFKGKTPEQIEKIFKDKGFDSRGPDPVNGLGGFVNPKTKRSFHIDPGGEFKKGTEFPHVDVNRAKGSKLPKKKFPLGDKLNSND